MPFSLLLQVTCLPLDDPERLTDKKLAFRWSQVGGSDPGGLLVALSEKTVNAKKTVIPPGQLTAGEKYTFLLESYQQSNPALNNSVMMTVDVGFGNLAASIDGGNRHVGSTQEVLLLDASQSYDEDNTLEPMRYTWECVDASGSACVDGKTLPFAMCFRCSRV